jgi:tetratricopeptide (TPR) repeat protein
MDLLAKHRDSEPIEEIDFGDGLAIRRISRPRRQPAALLRRPFDAQEMLLEDSEKDLTLWSATSLIKCLRENLSTIPPADVDARQARITRLDEVARELRNRGFDADSLVRFMGAGVIAARVFAATIVPLFLAATTRLEATTSSPPPPFPLPAGDLDPWEEFLFQDELTTEARLLLASENGLPFCADQATRARTQLDLFTRVIAAGPIEAIFNWTIPVRSVPDPGPPRYDIAELQWVVDRFTSTYLSDWPSPSLKYEWEWMQAQRSAPCHASQMSCRAVDSAKLNEEAARRFADRRADAQMSRDADVYVTPALAMLREGKRQEAAAVFQAIAQVFPDDPKAHNNWGFCLLIDEPAHALEELETAARLGFGDNSVNVGNRMFALWRLGRFTTALVLAEKHYETSCNRDPEGRAFMWSFAGEEPEVIEIGEVSLYVMELASLLSERADDSGLARVWAERVRQRS